MYYPNKRKFIQYARRGNIIPVYRELISDMETPVALFQRLDKGGCGYLLESVEGGEHLGRYSFLGVEPAVIFRSKGREVQVTEKGRKRTWITDSNPLDELKKIMSRYKAVTVEGLPRFSGGAVGYIGYNAVRYFEDIPQGNPDDLHLPDMYFMITDTLIIFDHVKHVIKVLTNAHIDKDPPGRVYDKAVKNIERIVRRSRSRITTSSSLSMAELARRTPKLKVKSNFSRKQFEDIVRKAKTYIRRGDVIQVVLSQRFRVNIHCTPFNVYRALRSVNPSPYMYYIKGEQGHIIGSSPEILVRCEKNAVETRPIAGTRPRGKTDGDDKRLEQQLLADAKERAEHIMLVDLGRNDIGRVCRSGSVRVTDFMVIEKYSHVMHLVSNVEGKLRRGKDQYNVFQAAFPAGTVTGAPKIRAMQIIDELENRSRGPYAGAVCYFGFSGNLDSAITIRTIIVKGRTAYIQAGAGIVADSVPSREYQETVNKARGMVKAISLAETF